MAIYSHSKLSAFEQCPLKFKYKYIDKLPPDIEKTIEALLGTCVHNTLEWIYNKSLNNEKIPSIEETIKYYSEEWESEDSENIEIVKKDKTKKDYFNLGINFILNYYKKHYPFKDGTIECEKKVILEIDKENNHKIQGYIDRLVYNQETEEYEIHDYKTANSLPTKEKIETDRQLALYSIAIKEILNTEKNVSLIWHYLAHNKKIVSKRTFEELEKLKKDTLKLIHKIETTNHFPAKTSILCEWCEYKNTCPEYQNKKFFN